MKLYFLLDEQNRKKLDELYKRLTGKKLKPPRMETAQEMEEMMQERPNYTISKEGRE